MKLIPGYGYPRQNVGAFGAKLLPHANQLPVSYVVNPALTVKPGVTPPAEDFANAREDLGDGMDWPIDLPPEYQGEPMALWSQALVSPGGTVPFQQEALRNPFDDAFFEVHALNLTLANPNAADGAILTLATLGISLTLANAKDDPQFALTKDFVPANMLFGQRGAPFATPYNQPTAPAACAVPFSTLQIRFAQPWLIPPRWMLQASAASRGSSVLQASVCELALLGRKVPTGTRPGGEVPLALQGRTSTRLPYHAGLQFTPIAANSTGETTSQPADLMNVTEDDVHVTSIIGALTQFMGSTYGYGAFDLFPDPTAQQLCSSNPAAAAFVTLTLSDGYPVIPTATPVRVAFALPGGDWPVQFTLRPRDYLIAVQNITLPAVTYAGDPNAACISIGLAGWREVVLDLSSGGAS